MTYEQARVTIESIEAVLIRIFAPYRLNYREYIQSAAWKRIIGRMPVLDTNTLRTSRSYAVIATNCIRVTGG